MRTAEVETDGQRALLSCGIVAPVLYIAGDILMSMMDEGYSYLHQTISELNAFGAPTRGLSIVLGLGVYVLLVAFGIGIWRAASGRARLRLVGSLLVGLGLLSLWAVPFASMQLRGAEQDATHVVAGAVAVALLLAAMAVTAFGFRGRLRLYSIVTIIVMLGFGAWTAVDGGAVVEGLSTPWIGVKERISVYSYQLWLMMLALHLLSTRRTTSG
jgi:hypothetical protein